MKKTLFLTFAIFALFANGLFAAGEFDLSGEWDYCVIESEKEYPPAEGAVWEKIALPNRDLFSIIAEKRKITRGFVLYRKSVILGRVPDTPLAFQAGEIMNADIVYINGKKIGQTGLFPPEFRSGWSKFRHYPIPKEYLVRGRNTIDVVNYFDAELWFISPIRLIDEEQGNFAYMYRHFMQVEIIHAFSLFLFCLSLFFLTIFLRRKKEIMYFYFAGATFFLADMMILQFMENLYPFLPVSSNTIFKVCGVGLIFLPPFMAFFFRSYLELKVTWKRLVVYLFLPCACTLMMLVSQDRYHIILWRNIFLLMVPLYIADITVVSIVELVRGNRKGLVLFIALLPMFIFGIFDILVFSLHIIEGGVPLYPIGVPFMVVLIGLQLVDRFINNLNAAEKLNVILEETMEDGKRLAALDNELSIARRIQLANVPRRLPELKSFTIGVKYIPAENISGDFYNFHSQEQDRLGVLIADVSGHGVPASLIASMVKILFSTLAPLASSPDLFIKGMNAYLRDKLEGHFLTAGYCFIDRTKRRARYARAGHEPLVHLSRKNGDTAMREMGGRGRAIGLHDDIDLEPAEFEVAQGDRLVLFTDGLVEAFNDRREIFGRERLKALILQSQDFPAERAAEYIYKALREWNSYNTFMDDLTLIIIDVG